MAEAKTTNDAQCGWYRLHGFTRRKIALRSNHHCAPHSFHRAARFSADNVCWRTVTDVAGRRRTRRKAQLKMILVKAFVPPGNGNKIVAA
jgi:hypothetical protein